MLIWTTYPNDLLRPLKLHGQSRYTIFRLDVLPSNRERFPVLPLSCPTALVLTMAFVSPN